MDNTNGGVDQGTVASNNVPNTGGVSGGGTSTVAEPSVVDFNPDQLVRIKGSDKPVKLGDHVRGFQSEFTRASQRAAQLERQLQERTQRLQQLEQAQKQAEAARQSGGASNDIYATLQALPYLSGEDGVKMVKGIETALKERDMILVAALQKVQQLQGIVQNLNQTHTSNAFEAKISKFVKDGGLSDKWIPYARSLYLSYEGDDLDQEFPTILADGVKTIRAAQEAERAEKLEQSRRVPFVPGRGGSVTPSKPIELDPKLNAKQTADQLWDMMQTGAGT